MSSVPHRPPPPKEQPPPPPPPSQPPPPPPPSTQAPAPPPPSRAPPPPPPSDNAHQTSSTVSSGGLPNSETAAGSSAPPPPPQSSAALNGNAGSTAQAVPIVLAPTPPTSASNGNVSTSANVSVPAPTSSSTTTTTSASTQPSSKQEKALALIKQITSARNPFDIIGAEPDETIDQIRKRYRKMALYIHPDKCTLEGAVDAFDAAGKAVKKLENEQMFERYRQLIVQARAEIAKQSHGSDADAQAARVAMVNKQLEEFETKMSKAEMYQRANERFMKERKMAEREKMRAEYEYEKQWAETREVRVSSWRDFQNKKKKKGTKRKRGVV